MQRFARRCRRRGARIGFVPTMGCLHAGHLSLVRVAHKHVGRRGKVVVSIYVNPTQFGPKEDFSRYPRDLERDLKLCRAEGVDVVFCPSDAEMYPGRSGTGVSPVSFSLNRTGGTPVPLRFSTYVVEENLSRKIEGASRPTHFRGVTTVVAKLFNIVQPDVAVFGAKDWQQASIIKRMVADLNFPLRIVVAPTVREPDGVAMSSRNKYLVGELRSQATVLRRSIQMARKAVTAAKKPIASARLKAHVRQVVKNTPAARLDYVEFFEPETLLPVARVLHGTHMAVAVFVGKTRLIDNSKL
jgi:pantoate--beta-alanine ligase